MSGVLLRGTTINRQLESVQELSSECKQDTYFALAVALCGVIILLLLWFRHYTQRLVGESLIKTSDTWKIKYNDLQLGKKLGEGGFAVVYKAKWNGMDVAVKVLNQGEVSAVPVTAFIMEVAILNELRHPNVILFLGACFEQPNLAIVTELLKCSLHDLFKTMRDKARGKSDSSGKSSGKAFDKALHSQLPWLDRIQILIDACFGMGYLHDIGMMHHDLKSPNLLLDEHNTCKVADFGMMSVKPSERRNKMMRKSTEYRDITINPGSAPGSGGVFGMGANGSAGRFGAAGRSMSNHLSGKLRKVRTGSSLGDDAVGFGAGDDITGSNSSSGSGLAPSSPTHGSSGGISGRSGSGSWQNGSRTGIGKSLFKRNTKKEPAWDPFSQVAHPSVAGTPQWTSPEVITGEEFTPKADVYAMGVIISEIANLEEPYVGMNSFEVSIKVSEGELAPSFDESCPKAIKEVAMLCLAAKPADRPAFKLLTRKLQAIQQDWTKNGVPDHLASVMGPRRSIVPGLPLNKFSSTKDGKSGSGGFGDQYGSKPWWVDFNDVTTEKSLAYGSYFKTRKCQYKPAGKKAAKASHASGGISKITGAMSDAVTTGSVLFTRPARRPSLGGTITSSFGNNQSGAAQSAIYAIPSWGGASKPGIQTPSPTIEKGGPSSFKEPGNKPAQNKRRRSSLSFRFKKGAPATVNPADLFSSDSDANEAQMVIVKSFAIGKRQNLISKFVKEMDLRTKLSHPNIAVVVGGWIKAESLFIMTEAAPYGTLRDILYSFSPRPQLRVHELLQIVHGLEYMHAQAPKRVHKDLRASKILCFEGTNQVAGANIDTMSMLKEGDEKTGSVSSFASSATISSTNGNGSALVSALEMKNEAEGPADGVANETVPRTSFNVKISGFMFDFLPATLSHSEQKLGMPAYSPPEVILGEQYLPESDVYSFGMVAWEIISRKEPFENMDFQAIGRAVCLSNERPDFPPYTPELNCDEANYKAFCDIITQCWSGDLTKRPKLLELKKKLAALVYTT